MSKGVHKVFKKTKSGNIYVCIITAFVCLMTLASLLGFTINDKANGEQYSRRITSRYSAESSTDLSCYLILNKLENMQVQFEYSKSAGGSFYYINELTSGYIFDQINDAAPEDTEIELDDIGDNALAYLYANGFAEFSTNADVKVEFLCGEDKDYYKLINLVSGYRFRESDETGTSSTITEYGTLDDMDFIITVTYAGGSVRSHITVSNVKVGRAAFKELPDGVSSGTILGQIDTSQAVITVKNYQNYNVN